MNIYQSNEILKTICLIREEYQLKKELKDFSLDELAQLHSEMDLIMLSAQKHPIIEEYDFEKMKELNQLIKEEMIERFPKVMNVYYKLKPFYREEWGKDNIFDSIFRYYRLEEESDDNDTIFSSEIEHLNRSIEIVLFSEKHHISLDEVIKFVESGITKPNPPKRKEFKKVIVANLK